MLINKPQFNPEEIKKGQAYCIDYNYSKFNSMGSYENRSYDSKQLDKLNTNGEIALVLSVSPLQVIFVTVNKTEVAIRVDLVVNNIVTLKKLSIV